MNYQDKQPTIVLGSGGHAGVVKETLRELDFKILGLIDPQKKSGEKYCGIEVLGDDYSIKKFDPKTIKLANGVGSLPDVTDRWRVAKNFRSLGYEFVTIIHPATVVSESASIEEGVQIMAGSVLQNSISIGQDTIVNTGSIIDHNCQIGSNCHIAPGVVISGNVKIGSGSHIGTGAQIIQNIEIGGDTVIAAGAVVYKNIPAGSNFIQSLKEK